LIEVAQAENVQHTDDGMELLIFTADGDMRQALNNLQSTNSGFGLVSAENVLKVNSYSDLFAQDLISF